MNIGSDHTKGSINAPITIVECGDYECLYTGTAYHGLKEIMKIFNDKIFFLYFVTSHSVTYPHAQHAAEAAAAAAAQDKFLQMPDYLFEHQKY